MILTRRGLFGTIIGAIAAPIIVRAGILMPVKPIELWEPLPSDFGTLTAAQQALWSQAVWQMGRDATFWHQQRRAAQEFYGGAQWP